MIINNSKIGETRCASPPGGQALASLVLCAAGFSFGGKIMIKLKKLTNLTPNLVKDPRHRLIACRTG